MQAAHSRSAAASGAAKDARPPMAGSLARRCTSTYGCMYKVKGWYASCPEQHYLLQCAWWRHRQNREHIHIVLHAKSTSPAPKAVTQCNVDRLYSHTYSRMDNPAVSTAGATLLLFLGLKRKREGVFDMSNHDGRPRTAVRCLSDTCTTKRG